MKTRPVLSAVALSLVCAFSHSQAVLVNADSYEDLKVQVNSLKDRAHTLVVLDNDNTLTTLPCNDPNNLESCQYLGGTAWGMWQGSLPVDSPLRISPDTQKIYEANEIIFGLSQSVFTENDVPSVLQDLTHQGASLLIETARDGNMLNATEMQLSHLTFSEGFSLLDFVSRHALSSPQNGPNLAGSYYPCNDLSHRKVRYEEGVYYLAGQNKGVMLNCLFHDLNLSAINPPITQIVFMDDTPSNAQDVYEFFKDNPAFNVVSIIYHGMDAHRDAFLTGKMASKYQTKATQSWNTLKTAIQKTIASPSIG